MYSPEQGRQNPEIYPLRSREVQFRVASQTPGKLYDFFCISIDFPPNAFQPTQKQEEFLKQYFSLVGIEVPEDKWLDDDFEKYLLARISPKERPNGKGKYSTYSPELIKNIWKESGAVDQQYPSRFFETETEILFLSALLHSDPLGRPRQLYRKHMNFLGFHGDDSSLFTVGLNILELEARARMNVAVNLESNPELKRDNLSYKRIYDIIIQGLVNLAQKIEALTPRERYILKEKGKQIGFVPFTPDNAEKSEIIKQWNIQQTRLFADILRSFRNNLDISQDRLVESLASLHGVDIRSSEKSFNDRIRDIVGMLKEASQKDLMLLGHEKIAFLLSLGMEISTRQHDSDQLNDMDRFILEKVAQLNSLGFTYIHEKDNLSTCHDDKIHGSFRKGENGEIIRDLCAHCTPIQVESIRQELLLIASSLQAIEEVQSDNQDSSVQNSGQVYVEPEKFVSDSTNNNGRVIELQSDRFGKIGFMPLYGGTIFSSDSSARIIPRNLIGQFKNPFIQRDIRFNGIFLNKTDLNIQPNLKKPRQPRRTPRPKRIRFPLDRIMNADTDLSSQSISGNSKVVSSFNDQRKDDPRGEKSLLFSTVTINSQRSREEDKQRKPNLATKKEFDQRVETEIFNNSPSKKIPRLSSGTSLRNVLSADLMVKAGDFHKEQSSSFGIAEAIGYLDSLPAITNRAAIIEKGRRSRIKASGSSPERVYQELGENVSNLSILDTELIKGVDISVNKGVESMPQASDVKPIHHDINPNTVDITPLQKERGTNERKKHGINPSSIPNTRGSMGMAKNKASLKRSRRSGGFSVAVKAIDNGLLDPWSLQWIFKSEIRKYL